MEQASLLLKMHQNDQCDSDSDDDDGDGDFFVVLNRGRQERP